MSDYDWLNDPEEEDEDDCDAEELRERLTDYYGTATVSGFPMAMADMNEVSWVDDEEVIRRAKELGFG